MYPMMRWDGHVEGQDDPNGHAQLIRLCDWGHRPVAWLWEPLVPKRKVTLLVGEQEIGKSFFALDLAARLSRGEPIPPDGVRDDGPASTLILAGDDDLDDTLYPRLANMRAELDRVYVLSATGPKTIADGKPQISLAHSIESLHRAAKEIGDCRLIVIDPISAFIEGMGYNGHADVRRLLSRLTTLARVHDAAVLVVSHHRKQRSDAILHRTIGSLAFTIASRVVLTVVEDPSIVGRRLLLPAKMNLRAASQCHGRAFRIEEDELHWDPRPIHIRPDELQRLTAKGLATSERLLEVSEDLHDLLVRGPVASLEVHEWASRQQIPRVLLFQAKAMVGIQARRDGRARQWCWELPGVPEVPKPMTNLPTPPENCHNGPPPLIPPRTGETGSHHPFPMTSDQ